MRSLLLTLFPLMLFALNFGTPPPSVVLEADAGGRLDGTAWASDDTLGDGRVHILFYVDPDEKEANNDLSEALKARAFDREKVASVAVINMAATWLPNFAIQSSLEAKQKRYPNTLYVKDLQKVLVDAWQIADDSSDVMLFGPDGRLLYLYEGRLDAEQIERFIALIEEQIR